MGIEVEAKPSLGCPFSKRTPRDALIRTRLPSRGFHGWTTPLDMQASRGRPRSPPEAVSLQIPPCLRMTSGDLEDRESATWVISNADFGWVEASEQGWGRNGRQESPPESIRAIPNGLGCVRRARRDPGCKCPCPSIRPDQRQGELRHRVIPEGSRVLHPWPEAAPSSAEPEFHEESSPRERASNRVESDSARPRTRIEQASSEFRAVPSAIDERASIGNLRLPRTLRDTMRTPFFALKRPVPLTHLK